MHPAARGPSSRSGGFTLVEATVSIVIVALMFTAAMATMAGAAQLRRISGEFRTSELVARALHAEMEQVSYASPEEVAAETGLIVGVLNLVRGVVTVPQAAASNRLGFDGLDDYHGYGETGIQTREGAVIRGLEKWKRAAQVVLVDPADPFGAALGAGDDRGLKRITVTVTPPSGKVFTQTAFRSSRSPLDLPQGSGSCVTGFELLLRMGSDGRQTQVMTSLPNQPAN